MTTRQRLSVPAPGPHLFRRGVARVVDCKPDRPLTGQDTMLLADLLPVRFVDYLSMPFLSALSDLVGVDWLDDLPAHLAARDALFSNITASLVSLPEHVVVTQERVNLSRIQQLGDDPRRGASKPVAVVLHAGEHFVVNGHHRLVSRWLTGHRDVAARVLSL